jgi:hypothetical protein
VFDLAAILSGVGWEQSGRRGVERLEVVGGIRRFSSLLINSESAVERLSWEKKKWGTRK